MESIGVNNILSIVTGILLILGCCFGSYSFQKHLFSKYKNKVKNTINKDNKHIS